MNNQSSVLAKYSLYALLAVLFGWTISLTLAFVGRVLPEHPFAKYFALGIFDLAAIVWGLLYMKVAAGKYQKAIALAMSIFSLIGVGLMALAEIFFGGQMFVEIPAGLGMIALTGIVLATIANIFAGFAFHFTDPEQMQDSARRDAQDRIVDEALNQVQKKSKEIASSVAHELSERWIDEIMIELDTRAKQSNGNPTRARKR